MTPGVSSPRWRSWLIDIIAGGVVGFVVGLIVAWNIAIFAGLESGYEANLWEIFEYSPIVGILVVAVLAAGPILGITVARWQRRKRAPESEINQRSVG
jgi:hypothetical protein